MGETSIRANYSGTPEDTSRYQRDGDPQCSVRPGVRCTAPVRSDDGGSADQATRSSRREQGRSLIRSSAVAQHRDSQKETAEHVDHKKGVSGWSRRHERPSIPVQHGYP